LTEVLIAFPAEAADAAGEINPADADPVARSKYFCISANLFNKANDLMAWDNGKSGRRHPSLNFIQFGVTNPAGGNPDEDIPVPGQWIRQIHHFQRV
jgi:hypothetical protein